ncbi:cytochrome c oxidase subunit II [Calothrix sp. UHCC 0171]|uniref:cytochrome c oxidase subunit II n=1 Tax=Calothrix sp. UHCC 0171 TaxID=3110245 RepID=UPI002B1EFDA6|nr:cytochrome c oxidase subunit II [Calothrix sp. UHCC 0171]MEA5573206.1 cytochrome c oxidase subunit II [Calothrix sp. UHCC 0171]
MQQIPVSLLTLVAGILIALISMWVGQYSYVLMPEQASAQAPLVDDFFQVMVIIGTALFLVVQGAIAIFLFQYRQRPGDERDGSPIEGNFALEIFWTAIPSIIVIGLGIYSVDVYTQMGGLGTGSHHAMVSHSQTTPGTAFAATLDEASDAVDDTNIITEAVETPAETTTVLPIPELAEESVETSETSETSIETISVQTPDEATTAASVELPDEITDEVIDETPIEAPIQVPVKVPVRSKIAVTQPDIGIGASPQKTGKSADLLVNVTGMQFAWIFNYPGSEITSGELHVPVGADVQLNIAATDVIHALWIPQFRLKQDAIPGQATELRFVATKPGTYPIVCAELCGGYHGSMRSQVIVHTPEDFDNWLETNRIAQAENPEQIVAFQPSELSKAEYLAPYVQAMGVTNFR